jgi:RNA polymerase sigma-70 factor (ECF subfamily)
LPRTLGYARALLCDPAAAEDVVQDCYARLLERASRYDLIRDGVKLLLRAVTNACIDRRRERTLLSLDGGRTARAIWPTGTARAPCRRRSATN